MCKKTRLLEWVAVISCILGIADWMTSCCCGESLVVAFLVHGGHSCEHGCTFGHSLLHAKWHHGEAPMKEPHKCYKKDGKWEGASCVILPVGDGGTSTAVDVAGSVWVTRRVLPARLAVALRARAGPTNQPLDLLERVRLII